MKKIIQTILLLALCLPAFSQAQGYTEPTLEETLLQRLNIARANPWVEAERQGLKPATLRQTMPPEVAETWDMPLTELVINDQLSQTAAKYGQYMIDHSYYKLVSPEGIAPQDRVAATGYQAQMVRQEFSAMAFEFYIQPQQASANMLNTLLRQALTLQPADNLPTLLASDVQEAGIALVHGTTNIGGFDYNIYVLSIIVALPVDMAGSNLQCGHLYNDINANGQYDQGEGIAGERIRIYSSAKPVVLKTAADGAYCLDRPQEFWVVQICQDYDLHYEDDADAKPLTPDVLDWDYDGWRFDCAASN